MKADLPADLRARVLAEVERSPSPARDATRRKTAAVTAALVLLTLATFVANRPFQPGERAGDLVFSTAGLALLVALALTQLAARRGRSMLGRPRRVLVSICAAGGLVLLASAVVVLLLGDGGEVERVGRVGRVGPEMHARCGALTVVQGLALFVALLLPRRGSDPLHPAITGGALGLAAGAWTATMAYLRCPHADAAHCVAAHVVPALLFAAAGAAVGHVLLRVRAR